MKRLREYTELRNKGLRIRLALECCNLMTLVKRLAVTLVVLLCLLSAGLHLWHSVRKLVAVRVAEAVVETKIELSQERSRANENLAALNHVLKGRPLVIDGEWKAIFTCPAQESPL